MTYEAESKYQPADEQDVLEKLADERMMKNKDLDDMFENHGGLSLKDLMDLFPAPERFKL